MPPKRKTKVGAGVGAGALYSFEYLEHPSVLPPQQASLNWSLRLRLVMPVLFVHYPLKMQARQTKAKQLSSVRVTANAGITAGARA